MGFGSLIDRLGWDFGPVVVSWLLRWLVEFLGGDVCGCSGPTVFVKDFEFFILLFIIIFIEVFVFGICWRSSDCGCSLWRWLLLWRWSLIDLLGWGFVED